jgi:hypothetical protein
MQRNWIRAALVVGSFLLAACSGGTDSTGLKAAPPTNSSIKTPPTHVSNSRYILISGRKIPAGCVDSDRSGYWLCD